MNSFKNTTTNILVLAMGFVGMLLLKFLNQYFNLPSFQPLVYVGIVIIIIGLSMRVWASISFSKNKVGILEMNTHPKLVISGPYNYSRNPLYIGIIFVTLGFVFLVGSLLGLLFVVLFFIFWDYLIKHKEEPDLEKKFGDEYKNYKLKVNRWI